MFSEAPFSPFPPPLLPLFFFFSSSFDFDFCLRTSIPVLTTSTYVVAWPQGDQFLGGDLWHTGPWFSSPMAFASVLYPGRCLASQPIHPEEEEG